MPTLTTKKAIKRAQSKSKRRHTWSLKKHENELIKQKGKEDLINKLDDFETEKIPPKISKEAFLESGFDEIVNKKEFLEHFKVSPMKKAGSHICIWLSRQKPAQMLF